MIRARDSRVPPELLLDDPKEIEWSLLSETAKLRLYAAKDKSVPASYTPSLKLTDTTSKWYQLTIHQQRLCYLQKDPRVPRGWSPTNPDGVILSKLATERDQRNRLLDEQRAKFNEEISGLSKLELLNIKHSLDDYEDNPNIALTRSFLAAALSQFP
jgi:hypothetical protein